MSRDAIPLYGLSERRAQNDGVELFIAEGGYTFSDIHCKYKEFNEESARILTVYVNLDIQPKQMMFQAEISGALIGVLEHCYVVPWKGLHVALHNLLADFPPSTLTIVVQLPELGRLDIPTVDDVLACFVTSTLHFTAIILAVARRTEDWTGLSQVGHFVASTGMTVEGDAVALFKSLSSFMAPLAICEPDDEEFKQTLGTALSPTFLAHAVWNHDEQQLRFTSERDSLLIAKADYIFWTAFNFDGAWNIWKQLRGQLRSASRPNAFVSFSVTSGFFQGNMPDWSPCNCSPVVALCRTVESDGSESHI
jgi:hypothetical protein